MSALSEWSVIHKAKADGKASPPLLYLLGFVFVLFIGILVFCYVVTKRANPVFLDGQGRPVTETSQPSHH